MILLLILILSFQSSNPIRVYASESQSYFARIMFNEVYLYKTPEENDNISNIYFILPQTYFVELIDKSNNFYKVRYNNLIGYVKKDCVQCVAGTPENPFLNNISFRVYADLSETLWSNPSNDENSKIIATIPHLTNNIQYIGSISADTLISGRTNIWYYCKYTTDIEHYGYIYSDFCDEMDQIIANSEIFEYISNPTFENDTSINAIPKNNSNIGIIIMILSIPAIIFIFMILKGSHILNEEKQSKKEVVDY